MRERMSLDAVHDLYFNAVANIAGSGFELALWSAWGHGAGCLEKELLAIPGFNRAAESSDNAKCLVNLLIQPMISIWYHGWQKQNPHSVEEMLEARKTAFGNVQEFLGMHSSEMLSIHLVLDAELTCRLNNLKESSSDYVGMFHHRYRECVTGERIVEWDRLKAPIETWRDFMNCCDRSRYESLDANFSAAAFAAIRYAGGRMLQEFERIQGRSE